MEVHLGVRKALEALVDQAVVVLWQEQQVRQPSQLVLVLIQM